MPWKETAVVDLRKAFVVRALEHKLPFTALCREYGISPKTGYKWKERFLSEGLSGLKDQSRKPHHVPTRTGEDLACQLVRLKLAHRDGGPKKIRDIFLWHTAAADPPSLSTVKRIFDKAGLVKPRRRRKATTCGRMVNRVVAQAPNEVWTVDFKGCWYGAGRVRIEPLTVRDAYRRYVLCAEVLANAKTETVRSCFERLFTTYGLPQTIRSDNGSPFACTRAPLGLSRLSAWWVALGISLDRIAPGHPEQNGGHERMHRDIAYEVEGRIDGGVSVHQAALDVWRQQYNQERPHEALGMRRPAEVYVKSPRRYDPEPVELSYPADHLRRKVNNVGCIRMGGRLLAITAALRGWEVGLKAHESGRYAVWFGPLCLGEMDMETESFHVAAP